MFMCSSASPVPTATQERGLAVGLMGEFSAWRFLMS
jgi:hypothetical protein